MNVGWKRILPLNINGNIKTRVVDCNFFLVELCDINFHTLEQLPWCHICTTLMQNCLQTMEMDMSTLASLTIRTYAMLQLLLRMFLSIK